MTAFSSFDQARQAYADLPPQKQLAQLDAVSRQQAEFRDDFLHWLLHTDWSMLKQDFDFVSGIKGFDIIKLLGHGSSSAVYLARQQRPLRLVALKVLYRAHNETEKRRFLREAEYLAQLRHPGIAAIYSSGDQVIGGHRLHFIVMEYVDGQSLKHHTSTEKLSLTQQVRLIADVCDALFHAHQKGILHRDIKPENIIVDLKGQVRLVDFGVGRNLAQASSDETHLTHQTQILGTLAYMSPELLSGGAAQASIQSDIYALGVLAHETLCGQPPFELEGLSLPQAMEQILSRRQHLQLPPGIDASLGQVINKAMATAPGQRYLNAREFGQDLHRWLAGEPVQADTPQSAYYIRQFIRRNKALVAALSGLFIAALAAAVIAGVFAFKEAQLREAVAEEAQRADAVNQILIDILKSANPNLGNGQTLTVLQVVENAEPMLVGLSTRYPLVSAELRITLAEILASLGELKQSAKILADTEYLALNGGNQRLRLRWEIAKAQQLRLQGQHQQASKRLANMEAQARQLPPSDNLHQAFLAEQASVDIKLGRKEAQQRLLELIAITEQGGPGGRERYLEALHNLALLKRQTGALHEATALSKQVVELRRQFYGPMHPMTLYSLNLLGSVYSQAGKNGQAEAIYRQVLEHRVNAYGKEHPLVQNARINLLNALISQGKLGQAELLSQQLMDAIDPEQSPDQAIFILNMRAYLLEDMGKLEQAELVYRRSLALLSQLGPGKFIQNYAVGNNLAMLLMKKGQLAAAENEFRHVLTAIEAQGASDHYIYAITQNNLGECLLRQGKPRQALALLQASHPVLVKRFGDQHQRVKQSEERIARARQATAASS